jgi:hypothetical protein
MIVDKDTIAQEVLRLDVLLVHGLVLLPYQHLHNVLTVLLVNIIQEQLNKLIHVVFVQMENGLLLA